MEKYSKWRDPGTGIQAFLYPVPPTAESLPVAARAVAVPLAWLFAGLRTLVVVLLLGLQWVLVDLLLSACLVIPPVHALLARVFTAVLARVALAVLGFVWIPVETVSLRRTARAPPPVPFSPGQGDLIIANSSSFVEVLYLAFRYNPTFVLPISSTGSKATATSPAKITSWRRVSLISAVLATGSLPERSERGESLLEASKNARGPLVIFPEGTTSNNRALLRFATLLETHHPSPKPLKTFIVSFRYDVPAALSPSATVPIRSSLSPLSDIFAISTSPFLRKLVVRQLHASESPSVSSSLKPAEWESLAESLAATGRWKRANGMGWEDKAAFLEFRSRRR